MLGSLLHCQKAIFPIEVTFYGMDISAKLLQFEKTEAPIVVSFESYSKDIFFKEEQLAKEPY